MPRKSVKHFESLCVQPIRENKTTMPHQLGIQPSSAFYFDSTQKSIEAFLNQPGSHVYSRYGNPTVDPVAQRIADLEVLGSKLKAYGVLTSTGMSAIHITIQALLKPGDTIISQSILYGGTTELFNKIFIPMGYKQMLLDLRDMNKLEIALKKIKKRSLIYIETPVNPNLTCVPIKAICDLAKKYNTLVIVDNTFATPINQQALLLGADVIVHSTTKFIHGHGSSMGGAIVTKNKELMHQYIWPALKLVGSTSNSFDAWLIHLGIKTLALRMQRHNENALQLAQFLASKAKVKTVNYPGLLEHPDHPIAVSQMTGFGALLSFELKGKLKDTIQYMDRLRIASNAPSLGETDTMVLHPASSSHLRVEKSVREKYGITDSLIRVSVGLENIEELKSDFENAFA